MPKEPPRSYNRNKTLDKTLLSTAQSLSFPQLISQIHQYPNTHIPKLISFKIASTSFMKSTYYTSETYITKTKAYDIYKYLYITIFNTDQNFPNFPKPLNQAHFGKIMKLVHDPKTKRIGSRIRSTYVYDGMEIVPEVLTKYEEWIENNKTIRTRKKQEIGKILQNWLKDENMLDNKIMIRCDLILSNFTKFELVTMSLDWEMIDINTILQKNNINCGQNGGRFEIMDIFNTSTDKYMINVPGIEVDLEMNKLKCNVIKKIHMILKHTNHLENQILVIKYISTRILENLTMNKSSSFGSYWIIKCLFDELLPICQAFYEE